MSPIGDGTTFLLWVCVWVKKWDISLWSCVASTRCVCFCVTDFLLCRCCKDHSFKVKIKTGTQYKELFIEICKVNNLYNWVSLWLRNLSVSWFEILMKVRCLLYLWIWELRSVVQYPTNCLAYRRRVCQFDQRGRPGWSWNSDRLTRTDGPLVRPQIGSLKFGPLKNFARIFLLVWMFSMGKFLRKWTKKE
jgi:hypothetical protein